MPRVVKAKTIDAKNFVAHKPTAAVAAAAPTTPPTAATVVKAATAAAAPKAVAKAVPVKVVPAEAETVVESVEGESEVERKIEQRLQDMIDELKEYKSMVSGMCNNYIEQLADAKREIRQLKRTQKKPRPTNVNGPKKPSVFEVLTGISDDMCAFLEVPPGSKMSRNEVTHRIHLYCKKNGLLQDGDQRIINADEALKAILSPLPPGEKLTYLNLQKYLKHNYLK